LAPDLFSREYSGQVFLKLLRPGMLNQCWPEQLNTLKADRYRRLRQCEFFADGQPIGEVESPATVVLGPSGRDPTRPMKQPMPFSADGDGLWVLSARRDNRGKGATTPLRWQILGKPTPKL
jgi:hypothetical protein